MQPKYVSQEHTIIWGASYVWGVVFETIIKATSQQTQEVDVGKVYISKGNVN